MSRGMSPRRAVLSLEPQVRVVPDGGRIWTVARIGMGPWPARIVLDRSNEVMRIEVDVPGVGNTAVIEPALDGFPFGRPEVSYSLQPGAVTATLFHRVGLGPTEPEVVLDLVLRLAAATGHFVHRVWDDLRPGERDRLATLGVHDRDSIPDLPREGVREEPVPYAPWAADTLEPSAVTPGPPAEPSVVEQMASRFRVAAHNITPDRADFSVDEMVGSISTADDRTIKLRIDIDQVDDRAAATEFARRHDRVGRGGRLRLRGSDGRPTISYEAQGPLNAFGNPIGAAQAIQAAWRGRGSGHSSLVTSLTNAGITVPHLGALRPGDIDDFGRWHWGSRWLDPFSLYMFETDLVAQHLRNAGHLFALSHRGHGANSYGINLVVSAGPIAAFVQHGWGGAYSDPERELLAINATYTRLRFMMASAVERPTERPRWLLVLSNFRGRPRLVDLETDSDLAPRTFNSEDELFAAAYAELRS